MSQTKRMHDISVGSFRDPAGYIILDEGRVLRCVREAGRKNYETLRNSDLLKDLQDRGILTPSVELDGAAIQKNLNLTDCAYLLEHPSIKSISYPYEWSFTALKTAALFHLDLHIELLDKDFSLSDASAYNVQFIGSKPQFIDLLSLRPYVDGEYWIAHRQFCEQFLNPLLLHARAGIDPAAWYRGNLEGIPTEATAAVMPFNSHFSLAMQSHVFLPARFQRKARMVESSQALPRRKLPKIAFISMLKQLRSLITSLSIKGSNVTVWQNYGEEPGYQDADKTAKQEFVAEFVSKQTPNLLIDLGCNTGEYSELSLRHGAKSVIAVDSDHGAADAAFCRARDGKLALNTLYIDLANESPSQGWQQAERQGFSGRYKADAVLALALVHHLTLGRNIPLDSVLKWIISLAPNGIIEFPLPDDPQVKKLTLFKNDLLAGYTPEQFVAGVERNARVVRQVKLPVSGRSLLWYDRASSL
jgi:ribosomal protein L11 methylase PrmA